MNENMLMTRLINLLVEQQALSTIPSPQHRICGDLGVCGGDFQEFMEAVWMEFKLPHERPVNLDVAESAITLADIAALIRAHDPAEN